MTITAFGSGTQTATIGTEHFLADVNVTGKFTFHVDLSSLQAGDYVELRVYQMILTGGTPRVVFFRAYQGVQPTDDLIALTQTIANELTDSQSLRFSLKQTLGTGRSFVWKVLREYESADAASIWNYLTTSITTAGSIGKLLKDNIDAAISSRLASASITLTSGKVDVNDKTGFSLSSAGIQAIWDKATSALTTAGSIGKLLVDNIDSAISTVAYNVWEQAYGFHSIGGTFGKLAQDTKTNAQNADTATSTLLTRLSGARATLLDNLSNLDATVSSRLASAGYTSPPSAATIAQAVWDVLTTAITTAGSIGKLLKDNIDAAISSRSTYAGADTAGTTTLLSRLTGTRATNLDNLDAAVSTRSTYAGADTAGTTTLLSRLTGGRATNLDNLDATVSSRSTLTAANVWDRLTSALTTVGSIGKLLVDNVDAKISTVGGSTLTAADVWAYVTRTITGGTITTNSDKTGYSLTNGQLTIKKNTALNNFEFLLVQSSDHVTPATGKTVTATRSIDGGAFASTSNAVTEVGSGVYKINLAPADLNGDVITLKFTATGTDQRTITLLTQA